MRLAAVGLRDPPQAALVAAQDVDAPIRRTAVHHQVLELEVAALGQHALDGSFQVPRLVERGSDDGELHHSVFSYQNAAGVCYTEPRRGFAAKPMSANGSWRLWLGFVAFLTFARGVLLAGLIPPFNGPDEPAHFDYVQRLGEDLRLPRRPGPL